MNFESTDLLSSNMKQNSHTLSIIYQGSIDESLDVQLTALVKSAYCLVLSSSSSYDKEMKERELLFTVNKVDSDLINTIETEFQMCQAQVLTKTK